MRQAPSLPEEALWRELRAGKAGVVLRRQVVLGGRFIVDFVALAVHLVVEVDGRHHERRRAADARRDRALERLGYRVLRLGAELVVRDPAEAVARIRTALSVPP
jgi:very-short-patch-repair endonuclease